MSEEAKRPALGSPDWVFVVGISCLVAVGLMMVYSSTFDLGHRGWGDSTYYVRRQLIWLGIGAAAAFVVSQIHYRHWMKASILIMAGVVALLITLVIIGGDRQLWKNSISPVELAKLAVVVYIGHWLASKRVEQLRRLPVGPLPFTIIVGAVAGLVMAQPDLSEAVVIVLVAVAMYFLAGADILQAIVGLVGGVAAFVVVIKQLPPAIQRLEPFVESFQYPLQSTNDQLRQGLIAIGSGGLFGLGPGSGRMSNRWLPAAHTDSIFAILGEELGMVGCLTLIGLFALIAYRGIRIAQRSPDSFGSLLVLGITCWFVFQALINMAVVTGTIPFTGIALPFVTYGGSSLVTCLVGVGIIVSVSRAANAEGVAA